MDFAESLVMHDMAILEFYLHRSITKRLRSRDQAGPDSAALLHEAHLESVIVQGILPRGAALLPSVDILVSLTARSHGSVDNIPFDRVLQSRIHFGAFIGYLLYHRTEAPSYDDAFLDFKFEGYQKALHIIPRLLGDAMSAPMDRAALDLRKLVLRPTAAAPDPQL